MTPTIAIGPPTAERATSPDGTGAIQVNDSASLTAASVTQGTLIIGGSSVKAPAGAAPVPEPSVWILLPAGAFGIASVRRLRVKM